MEKTKKIRQLCPVILAVMILFVLAVTGVYKCPMDYIFGIPCPMCGITRAFVSLVHGDIREAFYYHPLWPVALITVIFYLLHFFEIIKINRRTMDIICFILCSLLIGCFILRHFRHSPVVSIHRETSLIGRIMGLPAGH